MNVSIGSRIGVCLILAGIGLFYCSVRWLAPHADVSLEMPVSLSPGHVITGNFSVVQNSLYYIDIALDEPSQPRVHCEARSVLSTRWVLSSEGGEQEHGSSPWEGTGLTIAALYSEKTQYSFDVEVLPGASCLNASSPRLKVQTHPYPSDLHVALTWLSIVPVGIGLALLMRPYISRRFSKIEETRMFPDMVLRNVLPIAKHAPLVPIHGMPHWGLFCGAILWILMFIFMIRPLPSHGLFVSLRSHEVVVWDKSPWQETLAVYVRPHGRLFVNGEEVERASLRTKLLEHLSRRVEWTVYFEADFDTLYMDDIYAIETIQGCGAKLIWITPKMREEWQHKEQSSQRTL